MQKRKFSKDAGDAFYKTLSARVHEVLESNKNTRYANGLMFFKTGMYFVLLITAYIFMLQTQNNLVWFYSWYLLTGLFVLFIGFNISHDAAHHVIFRKKRWNDILYFISFVLQGNNAYVWKKYHIESHHLYTNVYGSDIDVLKNPLIRMTVFQKKYAFHRFQHIYAPFLYLFYSLNWFLVRDLLLVFHTSHRTISLGQLPKREVWILLFSKIFYLSYMILIPILVLSVAPWHIFLAFVLNHFLVSIIFTAVLGCSHLNDITSHPEAEDEMLDMSWATLQMQTSLDYNIGSPFLNWILGGFNAHTLHHLFPNICHIHYLKLVPVLRQTAREFGITYYETSYPKALASHFRFLKKLGHAA